MKSNDDGRPYPTFNFMYVYMAYIYQYKYQKVETAANTYSQTCSKTTFIR